MKKSLFVILALVALLGWREYTRADAIAQAVQNANDAQIAACDARIDDFMAQF